MPERAPNRLVSVVVLLLTTALILAGVWFVRGRTASAEGAMSEVSAAMEYGPAPKVGEAASDLQGLTVKDEELALAQLRGRPVWLMFNATWCASCRAENPDVQAAYEALDGDAEVVAVYLGEGATEVAPYVERLGLTYTHVVDPTSEISGRYQVRGVPMHFFIDADGTISSIHAGIMNPTQMQEALAGITG